MGMMTPVSPFMARRRASENLAAAQAILKVALPAPSFALTTSSPPNWMRLTNAARSSPTESQIPPKMQRVHNEKWDRGERTEGNWHVPLKSWPDWERRGTMVTPEWPPTTGMSSSSGSVFRSSDTKRAARTTSSVVTPNNLKSDTTLKL